MNVLAAISRERRRLERQLHHLQHRVNALDSAAKALGASAAGQFAGPKKRVLSAAAREKISQAAKRRWSRVRAAQKVERVSRSSKNSRAA